jgi:hypothetical protein
MLVRDMKNKKILKLIFISILLTPIVFGENIEIVSCTSGKNPWECEIGKACVCQISGTCTSGELLVYKDSIYNALCMPTISSGISVIFSDACNIRKGEIKVRASCLEGNSIEKTISIVEFSTQPEPQPTTIIPQPTTTIIYKTCAEIGEDCSNLVCCEGLMCCNNICQEYCEEEQKGLNIWILIIPLIGILIILGFFFIIKKKGEIE